MRKTILIVAGMLAASLALGLAIAAVCIAGYGTRKAALLEFAPEVLAGDVIVPPRAAPVAT